MKAVIHNTGERRYHWMDYAENRYGSILIEDIKSILKIYVLYLPLAFYWSLYYQDNTRFTIQASHLDGEVGSFLIKPEHIQVLSPLLCFMLTPAFKLWLYPSMRACNLGKPLQKITIGGILASVGFIMAAILEYRIKHIEPVLPKEGTGQIRIFNGMNCNYLFASNITGEESFILYDKKVFTATIKLSGSEKYYIKAKSLPGEELCPGFMHYVTAHEGIAMSYFIESPEYVKQFEDSVGRSIDGYPKISVLTNIKAKTTMITFRHVSRTTAKTVFIMKDIASKTLYPGYYDILVNDVLIAQEKFKMGGVSTFVILQVNERYEIERNNIVEEFSMHMVWMIPQFIFLAAGEVMVCVTGLQFSYYEAPNNMRGIIFTFWLFGKAMGNLIIICVVATNIGESNTYFVFGIMTLTGMLFFGVLALHYRSEWDY